jgi:hypothetical protein
MLTLLLLLLLLCYTMYTVDRLQYTQRQRQGEHYEGYTLD